MVWRGANLVSLELRGVNLRDLQGVESIGLDQLAFEGEKGGMGWKVLSGFGFGRLGGCMVCIHLFNFYQAVCWMLI